VSAAGDVEAATTTPLTLSTPKPGWAEQDPEDWWSATIESIRGVLAQKPGARVASIGISGQMHSSVFLDRSGGVVRPALLWWLAALASLVNVVFWMFVLFNPNYHAQILRHIGYGVGIPIVVELKEDAGERLIGVKYLILRSSASLMLYDEEVNKIIEIPIDRVAKITHDAGGLFDLKSNLP
jgi:hypothetical protein